MAGDHNGVRTAPDLHRTRHKSRAATARRTSRVRASNAADGDTAVLEKLGLSIPETVASIYWPDWITGGDKVLSAMEGPYSVPEALERAELLCALWAFERVVINIQDRSLWRNEWGKLAEFAGLD